MDREAFRQSIDRAMHALPSAVVADVAALARKVIVEHRQGIEAVIPMLAAELMPVIQSAMMEKAMGILDVKALEEDVMSVLGKYGISELPNKNDPTDTRVKLGWDGRGG